MLFGGFRWSGDGGARISCRMAKRPEILLLRRRVAREIVRSLGPMSAYFIAPSFGIPQPRLSELERGDVDRCSLEWLVERVYRMGGRVTVEVALGDTGRAWMHEHFGRFRGPSCPPPR